ncbi:SH3 domain-containing protein [Celeribacter neptunius]|uniref:SH3 domain-containing protein n=1 Tax=Celeribacter neptunius TaxID=588602 RepID=A0A1I3X5G6_9RHOB|nr:SH3 domain-containing protein [Celeribacter neptunius]SFK14824.1 SH3 domain-containing protein [Celeribacter neptunius]
MLRLIALSMLGLWATLMVFGGDLSPEERAALDARRADRTSLVAALSDSLGTAFGSDSHRQGAYVPTLAELKSPTGVPQTSAPQTTPSAQIHLASATVPQSTSTNTVATTSVTHPDKLAAAMIPTQQPETKAMILREVTASRVNVRSGPSTANPVMGQVVHQEIVRVLSPVENGWVKISVEGDGVEGYMAAKFLTEVSQ